MTRTHDESEYGFIVATRTWLGGLVATMIAFSHRGLFCDLRNVRLRRADLKRSAPAAQFLPCVLRAGVTKRTSSAAKN